MKRTLLLIVLLVPIALGLTAIGVYHWASGSEQGTRWLLNKSLDGLGGEWTVDSSSGSLSDGLRLQGFNLSNDGMDLDVEFLHLEAGVALAPTRINVRRLELGDVTIKLNDTQESQADPLSELIKGLALPLDLELLEVDVGQVTLVDADGAGTVVAESLTLQGTWSDQIVIEEARLDGPLVKGSLQGTLSLQPGLQHDFQFTGELPFVNQQSDNPLLVTLDLKGDEKETTINLVGQEPGLQVTGQLMSVFETPEWDLHFSADQLELAGGWSLLIDDGHTRGKVDEYEVVATGRLNGEEFPEALWALTARGELAGLDIDSITLKNDAVSLESTGRWAWDGQGGLSLTIDLREVHPGYWLDEWHESQTIQGSVGLSLTDAELGLNDLNLNITDHEFLLLGQGVINTSTGNVDIGLSWENATWPMDGTEAMVNSEAGELEVLGTMNSWSAKGVMDLATPQYPGGRFAVTGEGNEDSMSFNIEEGEILGGSLTGDGQLGWGQGLNWEADLSVRNIDPAALLSGWPTLISADLNIRQSSESDIFELRLDQLQGDLGGKPLKGQGELQMGAGTLNFDSFELRAGNDFLLADGSPWTASGLQFSVSVDAEGWLAKRLGGDVSGDGAFSLVEGVPGIELNLAGRGVSRADWQIGSWSIVPGNQTGELTLNATGLAYGDLQVERITANALLDGKHQIIDLALEHDGQALTAELAGDLDGLGAAEPVSWSGLVNHFKFRSDEKEVLSLQSPAMVSVSGDQLALQQACLDVGLTGNVCVDSGWSQMSGLTFESTIETLSPNVVSLLWAHDLTFTQLLSGQFNWQQPPQGKPSGNAVITLSPGLISTASDPDESVQTEEGYIGFDMTDGQLEYGEFDIPMARGGGIDVDFNARNVALDGSARLDGDIAIKMADLSLIETFSSSLDEIVGSLDLKLEINGAVRAPVVKGKALLDVKQVAIPYLGLLLTDLTVDAEAKGNGMAQLSGGFQSGEGRAMLEAVADFQDLTRPGFELTVIGDALQVLDIPNVQINATPDFSIGYEDDLWTIGGSVDIPQAAITPSATPVSKVVVSPDASVVAGQLADTAESTGSEREVNIAGALELTLGQDVRIEADAIVAKLDGGLLLTWLGRLKPDAEGRIGVNGDIEVFGPRLSVTDGSIRFGGGPIDNPVLDLRAERDVLGNTQIRSAGVLVSGNARKPVIEAYTRPFTTRERAWALLITGQDFDQGQSIGALDVGTYIAPRIYLSYGVSLFDNQNVVSVRLDLKKGFGVKATSGERQNGLDISYTVEK